MVSERTRFGLSGGSKRTRRAGPRGQTRLSQIVEMLEGRTMLTAASIDVHQVLWDGQMIEAVRDEYVLRMPQLNAGRGASVADFSSRTPRTPGDWQIDSLGLGFYKLTAPGASEQIVTAWAQRQLVRYIEPNAVRYAAASPNDPLYNDAANWGFDRIDAERAWDTSTGSTATVVAVLDTGVDYNHPDLVDNMWQDPETGAFGFNAVANNDNPMDDNGHGTFAAGLIGAVGDNLIGLAGVNWTTQLMAVKVLNAAGVGTAAQVIRGANYVTNQKIAGQSISTVHCGFARADFSQGEFEALQTLGATGVVILCAAGNESNNNDVNPRYPANYAIPTLISVAASTLGDTLAGFSNFGPQTVHLAAPGVAVLSTRAAQANTPPFFPYQGDGNYTVHSGTSFSSAFVAGTAALLKVIKPTASAGQVRSAILDGVDQVPALAPFVATGGRLNLANSVDLILSTIGTVPVASFKPGQVTRVVEGDHGYSVLTVTVVLDRPADPGKTAVVAYETRPGGSAFQDVDFVAQRGTLTFSGAQTERSFRLRIVGDRVPEPNEQFAVRLIQASSRDVLIGDAQINLTIVDDDFNTTPIVPEPSGALVPRVLIIPLVDQTGDRINVVEGDTAQFVVYLDSVSDKPITVRYRTHEPAVKPIEFATAGRDYVTTKGTVTFRPGETRKIISVKTFADNELEVIDPRTNLQALDDENNPIPEIFNVLLYDPINAVLSGSDSFAEAQILDRLPLPPPPPSAGGFTITLSFNTDVPQSVIDASTTAALRWEQIIVGDLPDVVDPATGEVIDDVLIDVQMGLLGGRPSEPGGTLANAAPREFRDNGQGLPWLGEVGVDPADSGRPDLVEIMVHEFAHVLGFTNAVGFQQFVTAGFFTGQNAVREYRNIFGTAANPAGVPLDTTGGPGTAGGHWDDDVFGNELMTGRIGPAPNPLSTITVGAFQDMGYQVNYSAADPYSPPAVRPLAVHQLAPIVILPPTRTLPVSTQPIGGLPVTPPPSQPVVVRPPLAPATPSPTPGTRTPITRVAVSRVPVSTQPISSTPVSRQPVTRQPVTAG